MNKKLSDNTVQIRDDSRPHNRPRVPLAGRGTIIVQWRLHPGTGKDRNQSDWFKFSNHLEFGIDYVTAIEKLRNNGTFNIRNK